MHTTHVTTTPTALQSGHPKGIIDSDGNVVMKVHEMKVATEDAKMARSMGLANNKTKKRRS